MADWFFNPRYPRVLLVLFALYWLAWAMRPLNRADWLLENFLLSLFMAGLVLTHRGFPLSNVSYTLIFVFVCLHTIGAHYTYSEVPYDNWFRGVFGSGLNEMLGFERNHFDRLVHFSFGFLLAYPIREVFLRIAGARGFWGYYLPLDVTMSFSMLFELFEWAAAMFFGGELGQAYLGTQGDVWDAHKDMALASLGALLSMCVVAAINWKYSRRFGEEWRESFSVKGPPLGEQKLREYLEEDDRSP